MIFPSTGSDGLAERLSLVPACAARVPAAPCSEVPGLARVVEQFPSNSFLRSLLPSAATAQM